MAITRWSTPDVMAITKWSIPVEAHRRHECAGWEKTMFLLARYTVAAAVFLSASAASAVEDATLSADRMLPACTAFIRDRGPGDVDGVFAAGRCIGLMQGVGFASRLLGACPPDEVTVAQRARVAVTYVEARPFLGPNLLLSRRDKTRPRYYELRCAL